MKTIPQILTLLIGISFLTATVQARGERDGKRGGGGGGKAAQRGGGGGGGGSKMAQQRVGGSSDRRSPMTGSKISRPSAQPSNRPVSRPTPLPQNRPAQRPETRPAQRPDVKLPPSRPSINRPDNQLPNTRPDNKLPNTRPDNKLPNTRPDNKLPNTRPEFNRPDNKLPNTRPDNKLPNTRPDFSNRPDNKLPNNRPDFNRPMPQPDRPGLNRPTTLPGMVTYPNRPGTNRPNSGNGNRPNFGNQNIGNTVNIKDVNVGGKNNYLNRPTNLIGNNNKPNWDNNKWGGNHGVWGNNNNINVNIDNHFKVNNNYSYRPDYWGARPWWGANSCHSWHHGHWNYGYNNYYYGRRYYYNDSSFASGFMWGITVWSLGNMVYNMGYQTYHNPYPAPAVVYYPVSSSGGGSSKSSIDYAQPLSVTAAAAPPGDTAASELAETNSAAATEISRAAFKKGDYLAALKSADEAIAYTPGDVTLHEYRALVLFTLGRYSDAAGVLNPVLASGPGWGWDTMVGFYDSSGTYSDQLRKLEAYVKGKPDAADGHFLLGYHYLVCGHLEKSYEQFDTASRLQPADSISRQLRDLTKSSLPDSGNDQPAPQEAAPPAPIPSEKLVGTWISDRGTEGKVTFKMETSGDYTWTYINGTNTSELKGTYGLNEKGLLVLTSEDSQMVSEINFTTDSQMKFVLVGAPDGDPGLDFTKG